MSKASSNNEVHEEETGEEEEEIDETSYKATKDAVLFAIEVSDSMLTPPPPSGSRKADQEPPATAALKCAYHLMQQRIISNPKDMFGVLLYGTETSKFYDEDEETRGGLSYPHCYLFTDLDVSAAEDVKELRALVEDEEKAKQILVPSKERVSMANVFFCANQIFTSKASNFSSRRLFIVTDNDNPHSNDKAMRLSATVRAKDLYDLGVIIELFPISTPDHEFDRKKFYDDIIYKASPTDPEAPAYGRKPTKSSTSGGDGISLLNSLLSSINSKSVPRRALFSNVPLEIGPDFKISVTGYLLIKRQEPARSCYIWIRGEKPKIVKAKTTLVANDTARTVDKSETTKAYRFGGAPVHFNQDELKSLRNFGDPVIRIIGFKPRSALPFWASIKHPTFIYPSEEDFVGSTRVFSALYQKLLNDEKLALVWFIPRRNAAPVMGAMIPGEEKLDDDGDQMAPQGMWILPLPFADDVRQNPETSRIPAPESMIDHMREVVQQLQLPKAQYDPQKYPNPSLQWHYRILQALALDEDLPEKPEDKTIPKYRQIDKRAGKHVSAWKEELESQRREMEGQNARTSTLVKRPAKSEDGQASKKMKVEGGGSVTNDVKANYEKGALNKLTVAILKEFLSTNNLSTSGKKADLVDRIEEFLDTK